MKRIDKIGVYFKLLCFVLLFSGLLVGYGFIKDVFVDLESILLNVENIFNSNFIVDKI